MNTLEPKTGILNTIISLRNLSNQLYNDKKLQKHHYHKFIEEVEKLEEIRDSLDFYDNHPLYMLLHREMHRLFKGTIPIDSFIIRVNLKPNSSRPALLTFDLFPPTEHPEPEPLQFG